MSLDSAAPAALIRQLQISLREEFSLPSSDPSDTPAAPPFPSVPDAVASLDPSLDASARCSRCRGGLLCAQLSRLCVYCGEGFRGGDGAPSDISFKDTNAYKMFLESLRLDGSEAVNLDPESAEPNKERDPSKASMILSDLLDIKLVFSPVTISATDSETKTKGEPGPATYDINLVGIDLDAIFKETTKETSQIKDTKHAQNQVPFVNQTKVKSSFAKWEPDFGSQPVNHSLPVQISIPASENLSKTDTKREVFEIETQADDEFDEWQDFTGLRASQNESDSVEKAGSSVESEEPVKAKGDNPLDSKDVPSAGLNQGWLSEEAAKTSPEDNFPTNAGEEDLFDDWKAFTSSGGNEQESSGTGVERELGLPEHVPVKNVETLNREDDLFNDWKNFTESGVAESGLSVHEEKTAPMSGDLFTINMERNAAHADVPQGGDVGDSFDNWNVFAGSSLGQSGSSGLEEKSKTTFWDTLNPTEVEKTSNTEEKTQPTSQDHLSAEETEPSDMAKTNDSFDDWNDFTDSSAVQSRSPHDQEDAEPISGDPLTANTTTQPSVDIGTSNASGNDSFDDWKDFTSSSVQQANNIGTSNASGNDSFDDWKDFTTSSAVQSGLPHAEEQNEPSDGNTLEIFNAWPVGGADSKKDTGSIDLWSAGVNGGVVTSSSSNNGTTDLSDGWLDFMRPSKAEGNDSTDGVKIKSNDGSSPENWLDFEGFKGPTKTKSDNVNLEKEAPDDLFDDWQAFSGSSQSAKPNANQTENKSNLQKPEEGDLSEDWQDFTSSGELKWSPEFKPQSNSLSDDWSNFTGLNGVKGPENKGLSDDWQDFKGTADLTAPTPVPVPYNAQDIDFGDFFQSSSSAAPTDNVTLERLNDVPFDPLSFLSNPSSNILNPSSNSNVNSRTENVSDIQMFLSQMSDLSFMLKDELSIPDELHSK